MGRSAVHAALKALSVGKTTFEYSVARRSVAYTPKAGISPLNYSIPYCFLRIKSRLYENGGTADPWVLSDGRQVGSRFWVDLRIDKF